MLWLRGVLRRRPGDFVIGSVFEVGDDYCTHTHFLRHGAGNCVAADQPWK